TPGSDVGLDQLAEWVEQWIGRHIDDWNATKAYMRRALLEGRSEEHTSELQSHLNLVCRLLLEKKKKKKITATQTSKTARHNVRRVRHRGLARTKTHTDRALPTLEPHEHMNELSHILAVVRHLL